MHLRTIRQTTFWKGTSTWPTLTATSLGSSCRLDSGFLNIYIRGSDGALWLNRLNTLSLAGWWRSLSGAIAAAGSRGADYHAIPAVAVAASGNAFAFTLNPAGNLMCNILYADGTNQWFNLGDDLFSDPGSRDDSLKNVVPFTAKGSSGGLWESKYLIA